VLGAGLLDERREVERLMRRYVDGLNETDPRFCRG
jgi:hypothetical protein